MKKFAKDLISKTPYGKKKDARKERMRLLEETSGEVLDLAFAYCGVGEPKAQLRQDVLALLVNGWKRDGFFVEFGAADGVMHSNSFLLEKHYGWSGILAEPARSWHDDLKRNRGAQIETDCVWRSTGEILRFDMVDTAVLSTVSEFSDKDHHSELRKNKESYDVRTISLMDLLQKYQAPEVIDYLSVDTEGSEYEILNAFDFSKYQFRLLTVEHNYTPLREDLYEVLTRNGYVRVLEEASKWDDWYLCDALMPRGLPGKL